MEVLLSVGNTIFPTNLSSYLPLTLDCNSIFSVTLYIVLYHSNLHSQKDQLKPESFGLKMLRCPALKSFDS